MPDNRVPVEMPYWHGYTLFSSELTLKTGINVFGHLIHLVQLAVTRVTHGRLTSLYISSYSSADLIPPILYLIFTSPHCPPES